MKLSKVNESILSAKKAVFCPEKGSHLNGEYSWREGDEIVYFHYDGLRDEISNFQILSIDQFTRPFMFPLMQKHLISLKKLPQTLVERTRRLLKDYEYHLEILVQQFKLNLIIPIGNKEYVAYHPVTGYYAFTYNMGILNFTKQIKEKQTILLKNLWKKPGNHTISMSKEIQAYLDDCFLTITTNIKKIKEEKYGLFKETQVIFFNEEKYWIGTLDQNNSLMNPEMIVEEEVISHLIESLSSKNISRHLFFTAKKLPPEIATNLEALDV